MQSFLISRVLDGAILLGVVTQVLSLTDFFLLPAQKKKLETKLDDLTLRLSYVNTARWLQRWLQASRRARLSEKFFGGFSLLVLLAYLIVMVAALISDGFRWAKLAVVILGVLSFMFPLFYMSKVFDSVGQRVISSLAGARTIAAFVIRYLGYAFLGLLLIAGCWPMLSEARASIPQNVFARSLLGMAGSFYLGLVGTWLAIFLDGVLTLTVAALLLPCRLMIQFFGAFMWRVSSYPKGPVAAITAIIVGILAVIRLSFF
jgi:hypothetical protein